MERNRYIAYVDESGDPGVGGRSSEWFVPAAVVMDSGQRSQLGQALAEFKRRRNMQPDRTLHWVDLTPVAKANLAEALAKTPFRFAVALWHCHDHTLKPVWRFTKGPKVLLYYAAGLSLAANVLSLVRESEGENCIVDFVFEKHGGLRVGIMRFFVHNVLGAHSSRVLVAAKHERTLLQAADAVAGGIYAACPRATGPITTSYASCYGKRLFAHRQASPHASVFIHPPDARSKLGNLLASLRR